MSRMLRAWELGAAAGHVHILGAIGQGLRARGHDVTYVLKDLVTASRFAAFSDAQLLQAPIHSRASQLPPAINYAETLNRTITRGDLAKLKFDVQRLYYDRGYILVRVVTPPQNLADGTLDIVVYEAVIGDIKVANDNVLRDSVVEALTDSIKPRSVFHERSVESMVNDLMTWKMSTPQSICGPAAARVQRIFC